MENKLDVAETPREFAMLAKIELLERTIRAKELYPTTHLEASNLDIPMPRDHPELMKVATLRAEKHQGQWTIGARAITSEPNIYYEYSAYFECPKQCGVSNSSALTELHQRFIRQLGSDLANK